MVTWPFLGGVFDTTLAVLFVLAVAAGTTAISLRLLGIRRGWGSALLAGALGWGVAAVVALALADWDLGSDGLLVHLVVIAVPATMASAVALDLLARPGSLATGEHAALVVRPRPLHALRRRIAVLMRYRELVRLAREQNFGPFLSSGARGELAGEAVGVRLRRLLENAGGVYVKLGQIAATRVDLLPLEICDELAELQNRVPSLPFDVIEPVLESELGADIGSIFAEFDREPLAAASIGQTYAATLRSGEAVVVKVRRPGVDELIERDLAALSLLARVAQRRTTLGQQLRSGDVVDQFAKSLRAELDFLREADAMIDMSSMLGTTSPVRIPKVYGELCTQRVLVQERFFGITLADTTELNAADIDRAGLANRLLAATFDQILRIGFFHADPHPGNIFVFPDGRLGLIDFGAVGRLDSIQKNAVRDMLLAVVRRDAGLLRDGIEKVADVEDAASAERLERALARLMAESIRPTGSFEPSIIQGLIHTTAQFGIRVPDDLVLLSRALVTLDGTIRVVAPQVSIGEVATDLMGAPTASGAFDPQALVRDELIGMLPHLSHLPVRVDRVLTLAGRGDLRLRTVIDEDSGRLLSTLVNRGLLLAAGSVLLVVASLLLVAADDGPMVASDTGLFEVFGYGVMFIGAVLLLRVVAAVARDGTT